MAILLLKEPPHTPPLLNNYIIIEETCYPTAYLNPHHHYLPFPSLPDPPLKYVVAAPEYLSCTHQLIICR